MKTCTKCMVPKELAEFYKRSKSPDSCQHNCKTCEAAYRAARIKANPEKTRAANAIWRQANQAKVKGYRAAHAEKEKADTAAWKKANWAKVRALQAAWVKANPARCAHANAKRRARKLNATPAWANQPCIAEVYELAKFLTEAAGRPYHVDHVAPLQGRNVCGLHVEFNLQVIPGVENQRKNNNFVS